MNTAKKNDRELGRLLRPQSVVVLGGEWARNVVVQCRKIGFAGEVWVVHPRHDSFAGAACFRSISDLPSPPDAAFVGVNRQATVEVVGELAQAGCGGAVCFASGFAEAGEDNLQQRLVSAAGGMPILGPNCYGFVNFLDGAPLWPDQHGGMKTEFGAAIIGQSSNILINISSQKRGLPISYLIAAGNQAQTGMADIARGLLQDDRVRAIGLYIEGIKDAADFADMAALAHSRGVPLAALKSGKSAASRRAAQSHTAALAGDAAASSAFLRKCGIAEARDIPELLETLKLLMCGGAPRGRKLMSLSCSGGEAGLMSDLSEARNIEFPPLPEAQRKELSEQLGPLVHVTNPLDYHTFIWRDADALERVYSAAMKCGNDLTVLVFDYPRGDRCDSRDWDLPMKAFVRAAQNTGARAAVTASLAENMPEHVAKMLTEHNIAPLCGLSEALAAFESAAEIGLSEYDAKWRPLLNPDLSGQSADSFTQRLKAVKNSSSLPDLNLPDLDFANLNVDADGFLQEAAAKELLQSAGVSCPAGRRAASPKEAGLAAAQLAAELGIPASQAAFALKALGIAHKTEAGAVKLNVSAAQAEAAAAQMPQQNGFLIEEMVSGAVVELVIGVRRAPPYGATLTVGAGGVWAELLHDAQTLLLPVAEGEIKNALMRLRLSALLTGYRGGAKADIRAAVQAAKRAATLVQAYPNLQEVEINPLMVGAEGQGAMAADALIRIPC